MFFLIFNDFIWRSKLYEVYENPLYIHLVMEYLKGGELFQQLQKKGVYSEREAALVLKCILEALDYCHSRCVVHRDLKPENLILENEESKWEIKIADFGLATVIDPKIAESLRCGSPGYVAPEVLNNNGYDTQADIFSAGIIFIVILTGTSPFYGKNYHEVLMKNKEGNVDFPEHLWKNLSPEAKDLATRMVLKDPYSRITAHEALRHPWFFMDHSAASVISTAAENMRKYNDKNRFNLEKIKPEFSMVTCTPLLNSRFQAGQIRSPLLTPKSGFRHPFVAKSPLIASSKLGTERPLEEVKRDLKGGFLMRNIHEKYLPNPTAAAASSFKRKQEEDNGEFDANDIDEGDERGVKGINIVHPSLIANKMGHRNNHTYSNPSSTVKAISTPFQNLRVFRGDKKHGAPPVKNSYFAKL